jgi:multiple antibiotic resistance protein
MMNHSVLFFVGHFATLFSIVDPLLAIPIFVTLTQNYSPHERIQVAYKASRYVLLILAVFFIAGDLIMRFFGISFEGLRIGGGLMIIGSAVDMLKKHERLESQEKAESQTKQDISFTPLAMPLLSGPGAIAVVVGMTAEAHGDWLQYALVIATIFAVALSCYWMMRLSHTIAKNISTTLMNAFTQIMGFLLLCVGVQYMINGLLPLFSK